MGDERFIDYEWKLLPRGDVAPHWSGLYVTMNPKGYMHLSVQTWERLGSPEAFQVMYDRYNQRLGLKPARKDDRCAYPAGVSGKYGGRVIRAYRLLTEFNIRPADTIQFVRPKIDAEGVLVLDLKNIRVSPKAHSQCRGRQPEWKW